MKAKLINEILKFSDGEEFDTTGELRIEKRSDGLYVMGRGMLIPVKNIAEANTVLADLRKRYGSE